MIRKRFTSPDPNRRKKREDTTPSFEFIPKPKMNSLSKPIIEKSHDKPHPCRVCGFPIEVGKNRCGNCRSFQ